MGGFEAGVFLIDKPVGPSSFSIVRKVKRLVEIKKVGHAGTLDPFASGLLIVCAGRPATKLISLFMEGDKEYLATLQLGIETTTHDPEGEIVAKKDLGILEGKCITNTLSSFSGEQMQTPPRYSALKYKGKPLYYYARKGIDIEKPPRKIRISELEWVDRRDVVEKANSEIVLRVVCSKGTYIRSLAADIGRSLGCGAHLTQLRRTRSGSFSVENGFPGEDLAVEGVRNRFLNKGLSLTEVRKLLQ